MVIKITGQVLPVVSMRRHKLRAPGKSERPSMRMMSEVGAVISAVGSGDMTLIWWLSSSKPGRTVLDGVRARVSSRTVATTSPTHHKELPNPTELSKGVHVSLIGLSIGSYGLDDIHYFKALGQSHGFAHNFALAIENKSGWRSGDTQFAYQIKVCFGIDFNVGDSICR